MSDGFDFDFELEGDDPSQPTTPQPAAEGELPSDRPIVSAMHPVVDVRETLMGAGITELLQIRTIEFAIDNGRMRRDDVLAVIEEAAKRNQSLSAYAESVELLTDMEMLEIRAALLGWQTVDLNAVEVDPEMARALIQPKQAAEWRLLPYSRSNIGELLVATADPDNLEAIDAIRRALPSENILFHLAQTNELARFIEQIYDPSGSGEVASLIAQAQAEEAPADQDLLVRDVVDSTIVRLVDNIIRQARDMGASDIHIEPKERDTLVRYRVDGVLREVSRATKKQTPNIVARLKHMARMRVDIHKTPQDGRISEKFGGKQLELRVVCYPSYFGETVTMRLLDPDQALMPLEQLGMSPKNLERYLEAISQAHGCCFITGPTGSGKSTTLYSSLNRVISPERKVISVEDPVEYTLSDMVQVDISEGRRVGEGQSQNQITFANALRSLMRGDPDIIMVGEIRDSETAHIAVEAALTGHFLYSTLHTNDALSALTRLSQLGVDAFLLAEAVQVIVAQRLMRTLCSCGQEFSADLDLLRRFDAPEWAIQEVEANGPKTLRRAHPNGCDRCQGVGYRGRNGIHEVVTFDDEFRRMISSGERYDLLEKKARELGMISLREDAFLKVWEGESSLEEMLRVVV